MHIQTASIRPNLEMVQAAARSTLAEHEHVEAIAALANLWAAKEQRAAHSRPSQEQSCPQLNCAP